MLKNKQAFCYNVNKLTAWVFYTKEDVVFKELSKTVTAKQIKLNTN